MSNELDGRRDFDFLHGTWRVRNRRLKERLAGSTEWIEFDGIGECRGILAGTGNFDSLEVALPEGEPFIGVTLRIFNPATREWSIYWSDTRGHALTPPVVGRFEHGVGVFLGNDLCNGIPVTVEFHWTEITPTSAKWDQAFSADGGATWETNWEMYFTRSEA